MGVYVYRVTAKRVTCSDGKPANLAVYAYKPYHSGDCDKLNCKLHFQTGCFTSERLAAKGKLSDRIVLSDTDKPPLRVAQEARVYGNPYNKGWFYDDYDMGDPKVMPFIEGVTAAGVGK